MALTGAGDWPSPWVKSGTSYIRDFATPRGQDVTIPLEPIMDFFGNTSGIADPETGGEAAFILRFISTDPPISDSDDVAPTTLNDRKHWYPLGPVWYDPYNIDPPNETMFKIKLGVDAPIMG
ncbi:hypothetical protein SH661x_002292 [Planctomicrobium sp. SH661]|uniref:hypothetical protein n=1 Tax=Planctomicrobium sp. SH661 TaxID=3448124 RepID=UPI003F5C2A28